MDKKIEQWDVWLTDFPYEEDNSQFSSRPVIVLSVQPLWIMSVKVTTHSPRENDSLDLEISHWRESGLSKPSTVRLSKRVNLTEDKFKYKLGELHLEDRLHIMETYMQSKN